MEATATALKEVDLNEKANEDSNSCSFCRKPNATKRCAKRHSKCLKKLFCDKVCETSGHSKAKKAAQEEKEEEGEPEEKKDLSEAEKVAKAKKKKAKKAALAAKKGQGGEFWWNNSVYASW